MKKCEGEHVLRRLMAGISHLHHTLTFVFINVCIVIIVGHVTTNVMAIVLSWSWNFDHVGNVIYECFLHGVIVVPIDDTCFMCHPVQTMVSHEGVTEHGQEFIPSLVSKVLLIFL